MAAITLAAPYATYTGTLDIGEGQTLAFVNGSATVTEVDDPKAPFPRGGRLRRIVQAIDNQLCGGITSIDGKTVDLWFRDTFGYPMPETY